MKAIETKEKKSYQKPVFQIVEIREADIICTSPIPEYPGEFG